jgi:hypothetical protein
MMRRLLAVALLLPFPLLACSSGTGDIPGPGCKSIQTSKLVAFSKVPAGQEFALQCIQRGPSLDATGAASCLAFHARASSGACDCPAADGLQKVSAEHKAAADQLFGSPVPGCICEVQQLTGANRKACSSDASTPLDAGSMDINGYCYVNGDNPDDNPELVAGCAASEKRALRFLGRAATRQMGDVGIAYICLTEDCSTPVE